MYFFVLNAIGFIIFICTTVLCTSQNNFSECFGECPLLFKNDSKQVLQDISCKTDHSCGVQVRSGKLSVSSREDGQVKDTAVLPSCGVGIPASYYYFYTESISLTHSNKSSFLQVSWNLPKFSPEDDPRSFPTLWSLNFIVDNRICITATLTYESLVRNKGMFSIPCVDTGSSSYQYLKFFYYEGDKGNLQVVQTQDMEILFPGVTINSTVTPWNSGLSYALLEGFLNITFTPLPEYFSTYAISIYKTDELGLCDTKFPPVQKWNGSGILPKTNTAFALHNFESCQRYCVQLTVPKIDGNCSSSACVTHYVDAVYFQTPVSAFDRRMPSCKRWNATMFIQANSNMDEISVSFQACCGYEGCFHKFNMFLYLLLDQDCNEGYEVKYLQFENVFPEVSKLQFKVDEPGNYCAKVQPQACEWDPPCSVLNSERVNILGVTHEPIIDLSEVSKYITEHFDTKIVILSCIIVISFILAFVLGGFFYWRRKTGPFLLIKSASATNEDILVSYHERKTSSISTFVLHTQDVPTKQRVFALVDVLRKCTNVTVELCEEHLSMIVLDGGAEWISTRLQVHDKKNSSRKDTEVEYKRQVIIVESERAVAHQNYHRHLLAHDLRETVDADNNAVTNPLEDAQGIDQFNMQLEYLFVYGLKQLMSKEQEALDDYFHLFVVHFTDITPRECKLQRLIPHARYYLPENIVALCADLEADSYHNSQLQDSEKLKFVIQQNPYFSQFMQEIFS